MVAIPARNLVLSLAIVVGGCTGATATSAPSDPAATESPTATGSATATPRPTRTPRPTTPFAAVEETVETPAGWAVTRTAPIAFGLVSGDVLLGASYDTFTVYRYDRDTLADLGAIEVGKPGFPPDAQSIALGRGGVWVTLAAQHAVGLMDPATGQITRRIEVEGFPYDIVQDGDALWIADFERNEVVRYDLRRNRVIETIPVTQPTDVIVAEGAVWLPDHIGRAAEHESIDGHAANVTRIDPATNSVAEIIPVGPRPYFMASGFGSVWTGAATGEAAWRIDATTNEPTRIPVPEDGVFDIEVVGDSVWAIAGPQWPVDRACEPEHSWFVRIDPTTNQVRELVAFPCPVGITPDGDGFWVSGGAPGEASSAYYQPAD